MGAEPPFGVVLNRHLTVIDQWTIFLANKTVSVIWDVFVTCFLIFFEVICDLKLFANHTNPLFFIFAKGFDFSILS